MPAGFFSQVPIAAHMVMLHRPSPEVLQVYAGKTEFNEEFGPTALVALARSRADARLERKAARRARYYKRMKQTGMPPIRLAGLLGNRPSHVILDDPEAPQ